jgi:UDP-N-acetylmuramate: L-alanyl-gamma-D-glutamyl-meso-diaminopimelate ligase
MSRSIPPIGPTCSRRSACECFQGYDAEHLDRRSPTSGRRRQRDPPDNPEAVAAERLGARAARCRRAARALPRPAAPLVVPARTARRRRARCARGSCPERDSSPGGSSAASRKACRAGAAIEARRACGRRGRALRSWSRATNTTLSTGTSSPSFSTTWASGRTTSRSSPASSTITSTSIRTRPRTRRRSAFVRAVPPGARRVRRTTHAPSRSCEEEAGSRVAWYALDGDDTGDVSRLARAVRRDVARTGQTFDLFAGGVSCGRYSLRVPGSQRAQRRRDDRGVRRGVRRHERDARAHLASFEGVRRAGPARRAGRRSRLRRLRAPPDGRRRDARALRPPPGGALWVVFEPRSATACRALHQEAYARAFDAADHVLLAPSSARSAAGSGRRARMHRPGTSIRSTARPISCTVTTSGASRWG